MKQLLLAFAILLTYHANAATFYVTPTGAGGLNGTSWANAYPGSSLRTIINASGSGDEVWVAAGTYYTTTGTDRTISFQMRNGVTIYGSFTGTETNLSQRSLSGGLTSILSAEIGTSGISDNSYHTIHNVNGTNATAIIDGFIIRDANDNRPSTSNEGLGGGIFNNGIGSGNSCSPTIRNCVITNNYAAYGAGIFNSGANGGTSSPEISNCVIAFNTALNAGGGIDNFGLSGNANPTITNCVIYSNTAVGDAGGMYCWGGANGNANPIVTNCVFAKNAAVNGGGIVCDNLNDPPSGNSGSGNPIFKNCILWWNTASTAGPQFFIKGTALFTATYSDVDLTGQSSPHVIAGTGIGNLNTDPIFVSPNIGAGDDGIWLTDDDGLQLEDYSPCVDTGDNAGIPALDIRSTPRIINTIVDLGAYERTPTTGILSPQESAAIVLFPNPTKNYVSLSGVEHLESNLSLYNNTGILVKEFSAQTKELSLEELPAGIYLLSFRSSGKVISKKIIRE